MTFLTIPEFISKYDVSDSKVRRRIYKLRNTDPEKYKEIVKENKTYYGKMMELDESWWATELKAKTSTPDTTPEPEERLSKDTKAQNKEQPQVLEKVIELQNQQIEEGIKREERFEKDTEFMREVIKTQSKEIEASGKRADEFLRRYGEINVLLQDLQNKFYLLEESKEPYSTEYKESEEPEEESKEEPEKEKDVSKEDALEKEVKEEIKEEKSKEDIPKGNPEEEDTPEKKPKEEVPEEKSGKGDNKEQPETNQESKAKKESKQENKDEQSKKGDKQNKPQQNAPKKKGWFSFLKK